METIGAWDVYWVMQLDSIVALFESVAVIGGILLFVMLVWAPIFLDRYMVFDKKTAIKVAKFIVTLTSISAAMAAFTPSTKTAAAMIVLPSIANSEAVRREAGDLYAIAKQALSEAAGTTTKSAE